MDHDCDGRQVVRTTCSGRLATISLPVPDFTRHLPEKSHHSIPTYSNVKTYVAGPHPSGVQAHELEQFFADLIHGN
jgi:DNA topoisomerase VI subunit B